MSRLTIQQTMDLFEDSDNTVAIISLDSFNLIVRKDFHGDEHADNPRYKYRDIAVVDDIATPTNVFGDYRGLIEWVPTMYQLKSNNWTITTWRKTDG